MTRLYPIYHGLVAAAPWGVACERATAPKAELLLLCRTEKEAAHLANLTGLGHGLKSMRDAKVAEREGARSVPDGPLRCAGSETRSQLVASRGDA